MQVALCNHWACLPLACLMQISHCHLNDQEQRLKQAGQVLSLAFDHPLVSNCLKFLNIIQMNISELKAKYKYILH